MRCRKKCKRRAATVPFLTAGGLHRRAPLYARSAVTVDVVVCVRRRGVELRIVGRVRYRAERSEMPAHGFSIDVDGASRRGQRHAERGDDQRLHVDRLERGVLDHDHFERERARRRIGRLFGRR
jgi:hypothetical protein